LIEYSETGRGWEEERGQEEMAAGLETHSSPVAGARGVRWSLYYTVWQRG